MRNEKGQFIKGHRASPDTEFKKGRHWRPRRPYWDREWLRVEYEDKRRSAGEIAADFGITETAILFWLKKHKISTRPMSEIRQYKHWGLEGEDNPMYGRRGAENVNWKGGITPERQSLYSSREWASLVEAVWERDRGICQRCGKTGDGNRRKMHVHHIASFDDAPDLRLEIDNICLLCARCHIFVHGKRNRNHEFLKKGGDAQC